MNPLIMVNKDEYIGFILGEYESTGGREPPHFGVGVLYSSLFNDYHKDTNRSQWMQYLTSKMHQIQLWLRPQTLTALTYIY